MKREKRVLVTGACGYIGSHVARQLSEAEHKLLVLDNLSTGFRESLLHKEELIVGDVGDEALLDKIFTQYDIESILHFAAAIVVPESVINPGKYYRNNTVNTLKLIESAAKHHVKHFIFSSTAAIYGEKTKMPVAESDSAEPVSPYGTSKFMSECMLRDIAAVAGMRYVILRYFNVAGSDPEARIGQRSPNATHLMKIACETAVGKRPGMNIFGDDYPTRDGTCIRDYIHVEDLALAHLQALKYLEAKGDSTVVNCGYGHGFTVKEVIASVEKAAGRRLNVTTAPRRPGDVPELVAATQKIRDLLDWRPRLDDLDLIAKHAYQWELKQLG